MFPDLFKFVAIATMLATAVPLQLLADEIKLVPGLALKEEFNDNIFLSSTSRSSDFVSTLTPSLDFSTLSERRSLTLSTGLNRLIYAHNAGFGSTDYFVQSGFNYQLEPRLAISVVAGYVKDSRPDRTDSNGLTLKSGSDRQNYQLSGNYAISDKSASTLSYAYSQEGFDNPGYLTTTVHSAVFSLDHNLDQYLRQARLAGNLGFTRNLTNTSIVDNYTATLGVTKKIHELWFVSLNAGGRFTHSDFDGDTMPVRDNDLGWIGSLSINYRDEKTNGSLAFTNDVTTASGRGGTTERTGVSATISEKFSGELSGFFGMGYSWNRSGQNQFASQAIDERSLSVNGGLRYDFSENLFLDGSYYFNTIDYNLVSAQASQNIFMLRLTVHRDLLNL